MTTPSHQQRPASPNTPSSSNGQHQVIAQQLATLQAKKGHAVSLLQPVQQGGQPQKKGRLAWTGFSDKTLWDWLDLISKVASAIAIPLFLFIATQSFTIQQTHLSDVQHQHEVDAANLQHQRDVDAANIQHQETILKSYQDDLKDLMLTHGLITSKPGDEVRAIARTEVLSALRQLDNTRNRIFLQFLQDAHLIGADFSNIGIVQKYHNVIIFTMADLTGDSLDHMMNLSGVDLSHANLSGAKLSQDFLYGAILNGIDLSDASLFAVQLKGAFLRGADLFHADLRGIDFFHVDLRGAILSVANLEGANLKEADLRGADIEGADLNYAHLTQQQLNQVKSCKDAILPTELICHKQ